LALQLTVSPPRAAHSVFERAVERVGTDYLAQSLWDKYLDYELAQKDLANVTRLYSRVLAVPLDALAKYLERYDNTPSSSLRGHLHLQSRV
jgi:pre-mRNA-processing factor 39